METLSREGDSSKATGRRDSGNLFTLKVKVSVIVNVIVDVNHLHAFIFG